ncbi:unnamed protein product [Durusdinium trenchii]
MEIPFCVETLRVGDVILGSFPYEIYIERKAVCDLVSSVFDCRLVNQIGNQLHHTEYCRLQSLVIVEGDFSELNQPMPHLRHLKKLSYEGLRNLALATMVRLSLRDQLPVLRSDNLQGTAELINVISLEYPKLLKMRPLQYGSRKERPFRSRRGENPKETLASQLRCVRGVSEQAGRRLARNHDHVQSFLSAMLASADPVQWLVDKANIGKNSSPLRRPTAVRLAETLAGKDTLQRENFTSSLEAIQGISRTSATALVGHFSTRENMQQFLEGQQDPVGALSELFPRLSRPAKVSLVEELAGKEALAFEEYRQRIASLNGISEASAAKISEQYPDATSLCKALISELDPVFGAMKLAKLNTTGALNLVTEFLDGSALTYVALVNDIAKVGISSKKALLLANKFRSRRKLCEALKQDLSDKSQRSQRSQRGRMRKVESGERSRLTKVQMQRLLESLDKRGIVERENVKYPSSILELQLCSWNHREQL